MRRWLVLAFLALLRCSQAAGRRRRPRFPLPRAAGKQSATSGGSRARIAHGRGSSSGFVSFSVVEGGWTADVSVTNDTAATFGIDGFENPFGNAFGLMLFRTGLSRRARAAKRDRSAESAAAR